MNAPEGAKAPAKQRLSLEIPVSDFLILSHFAREVGKTPKEYIAACLMNKAAVLRNRRRS